KNHENDFRGLFKAVLDIKVCDPAMGSGHMLQACYSRIVTFLRQSVEEMYENGNEKAIWTNELEYRVRTQIARKCIYGADLNPYAVEIAKLVLWMKVFNKDKPFEFFDYNLTCGNSLIGVFEKTEVAEGANQVELFRTKEEIEMDMQSRLLKKVAIMTDMPRDSVEAVHEVEKCYQEEVRPLQKQVAFAYNIKISQWLLHERAADIKIKYESLTNCINTDAFYVEKIFNNDPSVPDSIKLLTEIDNEIQEKFRPLHWSVSYPHIAVKGGFDVILSNPPWDKVKTYRNEFFSDYIDGYSDIEANEAIKISNAYMEQHPKIKQKWKTYCDNIYAQIEFYQNSYSYQTYKPKNSKKALKGDANLYKVFLEKIYDILAKDGLCGIVIPDNLNIDNGCTGLRHMLLENTTVKELIMFENRKKLFDIDSRYKFNVLTFAKNKPRSNAAFDAGFYWYDPVWLDGEPEKDYIDKDEKNKKKYHSKFSYSTRFIQQLNSDLLTIYEFRNGTAQELLKKMVKFPEIGDEKQELYISAFSEFHMTNDSDLFNKEGKGWPLFQGKTIHHYNAHFNPVERFVIQDDGEARLAKKWKKDVKDLPDRTYRIGWRDISQCTNERSLVNTIIPRGVFCGNKINQAVVHINNQISFDYEMISGLNVILSSFCADMYIRLRISMTVSAFILKSLPVPRDYEIIRELGKLAMPLYEGDEFEAFRGEVPALTDSVVRNKLIAKLDSRVAHLYGLTYEEYQAVLETFPLVDEQQKKRCLIAYNDWKFSM
ncbi:MAG: N-6 DNA methylase, partial [Butyrivibrio sp.]|nr:N-6 DNA methylase [Butyrivibrio sp.]